MPINLQSLKETSFNVASSILQIVKEQFLKVHEVKTASLKFVLSKLQEINKQFSNSKPSMISSVILCNYLYYIV